MGYSGRSTRRYNELGCHIHTVTGVYTCVMGERISGGGRDIEMPHFHNFLKSTKYVVGVSCNSCCFVKIGNYLF